MEEAIFKKGQEILSESGQEGDNIFNLNYWTKEVMQWSMKDAAFKTDLFRFVDALPVLQSHQQVSKHLQEYFCKPTSYLPKLAQNTLRALSKFDLSSSLVAKAVKANAAQMAKVFITGSNPNEALPVLKKLREQNLTFTADLLGEASLSEAETIIQQKRYLTLIDELNQEAKTWPIIKLLDTDHAGPIPKVNISVKLSSLYSQINLLDFENTVEILKDKLRPILRAARDNRTFVNFDMEQFALKELTYKVFTSILEETEFKGYFDVGIVVQAYLKSAEEDLLKLINWCKSENRHITIRLVKGAYWDYEVINAKQQGWPIPVFTEKTHTDANYEKLSKILLDNYEYTRAAIGSHNVRSLAHALVYAEQINLPKKLLEVQMLYGMAEPIKKTLIKMGYRCRDYAPIGELIPGMAYLVRRLLENTSNESFLRLKFASNLPINDLLQAPTEEPQQTKNKLEKKEFSEFTNIPLLDFGLPENRIAYQQALQKAELELGQKLPLFINGEKVWTDSLIESVNPCKPQQIIVLSSSASKQDAEKAIEIAHKALNSWRKTSVCERANVLFKAAKILRERRFELSAWETLELAKTWKEADADIVEAADFCEYYATESLKLSKGKALTKVPGEDNEYNYRPKGVGVVISPWNFPMAIPLGMISAALVMGNPVVFKPASPAVKIGALLYEVLIEAGCPKEILHFVPGSSSEIGNTLIQSDKVAFVAFTGSLEVGLKIVEGASKACLEAKLVKKVIAEMGGKNALIIDEDADIDEAVLGTLYSAFGFQGQKCSALSRLIVHEAIYDSFMPRLREAILDLKVGEAKNPQSYLAAVVDKAAYTKIMSVINETKTIAKLTTQAPLQEDLDKNGYYIPPTLFEGIALDSTVAMEELFGPVLACFKVANLTEAVELANSSAYALTGGLYSRSPESIAHVKENLEAGNIYINRGITGAIVGRHPFGGFKLSGIGSKAGGPDYLLQFADPITVVENTLRKGFAPDLG